MKSDRDPYPFPRAQQMARINPPVRKQVSRSQGLTAGLIVKAATALTVVTLAAWGLSQAGVTL